MHKNSEKQIKNSDSQNELQEELSEESRSPSDNQGSQQDIQSISGSNQSQQNSSSSSPIEAAIKSMKFRKNRGAKMKDLISGNIKHDAFWERHSGLFGGDLRYRQQQQDEEDYQQSSSGQDQFDSDFNNTDSYPGKRGRKKGTKMKKRVTSNGRQRGRPKKVIQEKQSSSQDNEQQVQKPRRGRKKAQTKQKPIQDHKHKIIYKRAQQKPEDYFLIMKATVASKRGRKPKAVKEAQKIKGEQKNQ